MIDYITNGHTNVRGTKKKKKQDYSYGDLFSWSTKSEDPKITVIWISGSFADFENTQKEIFDKTLSKFIREEEYLKRHGDECLYDSSGVITMTKNLERNLKSDSINRFEKEGKIKTWLYIVQNAAFMGLGASFFFGGLSKFLQDNPHFYLKASMIGGIVGSVISGYVFYRESLEATDEVYK